MAGDIQVQCFKCKTVYELDEGFRGKLVECAVCNIVFTVPKLGEKRQKPDLSQDSLLAGLKKKSEKDDTKVDIAMLHQEKKGEKPEGKNSTATGKTSAPAKDQKENKAPDKANNKAKTKPQEKPKWWQLSIGKK
jgi:hypothetical protein